MFLVAVNKEEVRDQMSTPVFDQVAAEFKDAKESMKVLARAEVLAEVIDELKSIPRPSKQITEAISRLESKLVKADLPKKKGKTNGNNS